MFISKQNSHFAVTICKGKESVRTSHLNARGTIRATALGFLLFVILLGSVPLVGATMQLSNQAKSIDEWLLAQSSPEEFSLISQIGGGVSTVTVDGTYAYVGIGPRLVILDITDPTSAIELGATAALPGAITETAIAGHYAYVSTGYTGLRIVDVSVPTDPHEVSFYDSPDYAYGVDVSGNYAYLADQNAGLRVVDVSNPSNPYEVGSYDSPGYALAVTVVGDNAFLADADAGLHVVDVSNPLVPQQVSSYTSPDAVDIQVADGYAYIANRDAGLEVVDVSNPASPQIVGSYDSPGRPTGVAIVADRVYLADSRGLWLLDTSIPSAPELFASYDSPGTPMQVAAEGDFIYLADETALRIVSSATYAPPEEVGVFSPPAIAMDVAVREDLAFVAAQTAGLRIVDASSPSSPEEIGFYDSPGVARGVAIAGDYAYIADGDGGLRVVDISILSGPEEVGFYDSPGYAMAVAISGNYAYLADSEAGLRIIDVSTPSSPAEVGFYDSPGFAQAVDVTGGYAYLADDQAGMQIIDISESSSPEFAGSFQPEHGYILDVDVVGSIAYLADWIGTLRVVDVSNPTSPSEVGSYDSPGSAYGITVSAQYAFLAGDEAGIRIVDISLPSEPKEVGFYDSLGSARSTAVGGNHVYIADWDGGLRLLDMSAFSPLEEYSALHSPGEVNEVEVGGEHVYLTDENQMWILETAYPEGPDTIGYYDTPGEAQGIAVDAADASHVYVADLTHGVRIVDISNPSEPEEVGFYDSPYTVYNLEVSNSLAYIVDFATGLRVVDVSTPSSPQLLDTLFAPGDAYDIAVAGDYAYLTTWSAGLRVIDVTDPSAIEEVSYYDSPGTAYGVAVLEDYAYVADGNSGLRIVDISNPLSPQEVGFYNSPGFAYDVAVDGNQAYLADGFGGIRAIDVSTPTNPQEVGAYITSLPVTGVAADGEHVYATASSEGLLVLGWETIPFHPLSDITLGGQSKTGLNASSVFTATVTPITATLPITYEWQATDQTPVTHVVDSITDTVAFSWSQPGTKEVIVTATNGDGSVSASHTVLVEEYPALAFSTFLGTSGFDRIADVTSDQQGNIYVVGRTDSASFPLTPDAFDKDFGGLSEGFVAKFNQQGELLFSSYLGGSDWDQIDSVEIWQGRYLYMAGETLSTDFITTAGAFDESFNGLTDVFVVLYDLEDGQFVFATYLGGSDNDFVDDMVIDGSGDIIVVGSTRSLDYPTTSGAFNTSHAGGLCGPGGIWYCEDVFVSKISQDGTNLIFSTFLGGAQLDNPHSVEVSETGNIFVVGNTDSADFPTTSDAFDDNLSGTSDAFLFELHSSGSELVYGSYLGGSSSDGGRDIEVTENELIVGGTTWSSDFPVTDGSYDTTYASQDAFVMAIRRDYSAIRFSTFVGGFGNEALDSLFIQEDGEILLNGYTTSDDFPVSADAHDDEFNGGSTDVFVAKLSADGKTLPYATYLGGSGLEFPHGIVYEPSSGRVVIAGDTESPDFPVTPGVFDPMYNGGRDSYITAIQLEEIPVLEDVELSGVKVGEVDSVLSFTAAVSPPNVALPLTYEWQATNHAPVTHVTDESSDSISFSWDTPGIKEIMVMVSNGSGNVSATHTLLVVSGDTGTVTPAEGGTVEHVGPDSTTTTVQVPAGAVTETIILVYEPLDDPPADDELNFAGIAFDLNAYRDDEQLDDFTFEQPVIVTVNYSDEAIAGIEESELKLYVQEGNAWVDAATTCTPPSTYTRNVEKNELEVSICHLSRFALMGPEGKRNLYLPLLVQ